MHATMYKTMRSFDLIVMRAKGRKELFGGGALGGRVLVGIFPVCVDHSPRPSLDNNPHMGVRVT